MNLLKPYEWRYHQKNGGGENVVLGEKINAHHYILYPEKMKVVCAGNEGFEVSWILESFEKNGDIFVKYDS